MIHQTIRIELLMLNVSVFIHTKENIIGFVNVIICKYTEMDETSFINVYIYKYCRYHFRNTDVKFAY